MFCRKRVPTAASKGHTCSTEKNNKNKLLWGLLRDHIEWWALDLWTPCLQASSGYLPVQPSSSFLKRKEKIWMKKKLLPQNIKKQKENGKQKKKRLFCPHCHHTHLPMPHIKQACLQTTDYKSQTTTNCNPEMSIRTCIRMVKKRTNGAWLFQLTTATQCSQ